ncbi:MAG TPA: hypothetical protein VGN43_15625 [Steroidobacteraceae bacterium]|jgi:hypothetical protein|nr:hypothetical protein [Steroidobacteraceae bacterium]
MRYALISDIHANLPALDAVLRISSGAVMTGEVAMKLRKFGLPEPAALGIFSGFGDFSRLGDSQSFFTGAGLGRPLTPPEGLMDAQQAYVGRNSVGILRVRLLQ